MEFVQPASLNRLVDPPLTWRKKLEVIKPLLPSIVVSGVIMAELVAFRLWAENKNILTNLPLVLLALLVPPAVCIAAIELNFHVNNWTKRRLRLGTKGIRITHAKHGNIRWEQVKRWLFAPVPDQPEHEMVTVEYTLDRSGRRIRSWRIVLAHPDQAQVLKTELNHLRERGITTAPVIELSEPIAPPERKLRVRGMVQAALALFFFAHAVPLLTTGLSSPDRHANQPLRAMPSEAAQEDRGRAVLRRFASQKEFRRACVIGGSVLAALSAAFYAWGLIAMWQAAKKAESNSSGTKPEP
ncbi:MAG: hypothetical protein N2379_05320 [Verrucomicrobiae bacterium]|nr:hypothetical protein [Verrucomicrobiae bacterium]